MVQDADSAEEATSAAQRPRRPAPPASWTESRPTSSAPVEHCVGLSTPEGTLAAREEDIEAYVAQGRQRSARRPGLGEAPGRGCEDVEAQLEGSPSCKSASDGGKKEVEVGEEDEWTYPDGGRRAWGVVFGVWCLSASQLGYLLCFGVFLEDLEQRLDQTAATLNFIQGLTNLGSNAVSFWVGRLGDRYGYKKCIGAGCVLSVLSLVGAALSYESLPALFVTQGALLGVSQGLGMSLFMALPSQWFLERRGLATGISMSGSGIGGAIASLILRSTIKLGYRNAVFIYTGVNAVAYLVGFLLIEERRPPLRPGERKVPKRWLPKGVWKDARFYSLMVSVSVAVFGYLPPFYFITALTKQQCPEYDPDSLVVAAPLIVGSAVCGIGRVFGGFVADRIGPVNTLILSFLVGGLSQLVMWPHITSFGAIMAFACLYGWFGSWVTPLLAPCCAQIFGTKGLATIVGFGVLCNAPGQFLGGSIAGWTLDAAGGRYGTVGYYSGSVMLAGAVTLLPARWMGRRELWAKY
ncbi:major facilitator superfamily domain-containing protein [Rhodotorula diobovata]|uniref:Major facilitator superfamily domain-containing protein n=1 Tax=Rhodotorula diobovata TaxID=5288 RepID=A0A5C5FMY7_9BASI|nr:major facilitator superfamily domain-containing protein [Rhodotorula diobovata]